MLFNSLDFLLFAAVVLPLYFAVPHRYRWGFLLAASYYFYACWKLEYVVLIAASTGVDYWAGLRMGAEREKRRRRPYLIASLCCNLGLLFAFKYFNFFNEAARALFSQVNVFYDVPAFDVLLPVGISFYTFQTLSYSIDVYRGKKKPERHFGIFALYVSFFPQLVAGPIERSTRLLPQFREHHHFERERVRSGVLLVLWGFFKKLVIADRLAAIVGQIHAEPGAHSSAVLLLGAYLFAYQLYCDFSGYTDIARGTARILGFRLTENFRRPFAAQTSAAFWERWHISLTRWIRDYVYVPLARRTAAWQRPLVVLFVFVLFGLWHGAAWNFVLFGASVGLMVVIGQGKTKLQMRLRKRLAKGESGRSVLQRASFWSVSGRMPGALRVLFIFHLFVLGCVMFRAESLSHLTTYLASMTEFSSLPAAVEMLRASPVVDPYPLLLAAVAIVVMEGVQWWGEHRWPVWTTLARKPAWVRWPVYYALVFSILMLGAFRVEPFIYFQF